MGVVWSRGSCSLSLEGFLCLRGGFGCRALPALSFRRVFSLCMVFPDVDLSLFSVLGGLSLFAMLFLPALLDAQPSFTGSPGCMGARAGSWKEEAVAADADCHREQMPR